MMKMNTVRRVLYSARSTHRSVGTGLGENAVKSVAACEPMGVRVDVSTVLRCSRIQTRAPIRNTNERHRAGPTVDTGFLGKHTGGGRKYGNAPVYRQYTQEFFHRMVRSCAPLLTAYSVGKCSGCESGAGTFSSSIIVSARLSDGTPRKASATKGLRRAGGRSPRSC